MAENKDPDTEEQKRQLEAIEKENEKRRTRRKPHPSTSVPAGKFRCQQPPGLVYR